MRERSRERVVWTAAFPMRAQPPGTAKRLLSQLGRYKCPVLHRCRPAKRIPGLAADTRLASPAHLRLSDSPPLSAALPCTSDALRRSAVHIRRSPVGSISLAVYLLSLGA